MFICQRTDIHLLNFILRYVLNIGCQFASRLTEMEFSAFLNLQRIKLLCFCPYSLKSAIFKSNILFVSLFYFIS